MTLPASWPQKKNIIPGQEYTRYELNGIKKWNAAIDICEGALREEQSLHSPQLKPGYVPEEMEAGKAEIPAWKEPIDYEPMVHRAKLINQINKWYKKRFAGESGMMKVSVFDLIADFVMEAKLPAPTERVALDKMAVLECLKVNQKYIPIQDREEMADKIIAKFSPPKAQISRTDIAFMVQEIISEAHSRKKGTDMSDLIDKYTNKFAGGKAQEIAKPNIYGSFTCRCGQHYGIEKAQIKWPENKIIDRKYVQIGEYEEAAFKTGWNACLEACKKAAGEDETDQSWKSC